MSDVRLYFEYEPPSRTDKSLEKDYERIEQREYYLETGIGWLAQQKNWAGLNGTGTVKASTTSLKTDELTEESRDFLTSLTDVYKLADTARKHWSTESLIHGIFFYAEFCDKRYEKVDVIIPSFSKNLIGRGGYLLSSIFQLCGRR